MGHISNPVGFRLGFSRSWLVKCAPPHYNYQEDLYKEFSNLFRALFRNRRMELRTIIYSHTCINFNSSLSIKANVFLYDARFELAISELNSLYIKRFKKARVIRKQLLNINPNLKLFHTEMTYRPFYRTRFKNILNDFLLKNIRNRWYVLISNRINQVISLGLRFPKCINTNIMFYSNNTITAKAIGLYAIRKLKFRNSLDSIFKPMMRNLSYLFTGFRVICVGRFTRNQRATLSIYNYGSTKLSTFSSDMDYYHTSIPLKYGVGSLKIWINHGFRSKGTITNYKNIRDFQKKFIITND